ncbi:MAG TPA: hypothetical protein VMW42_11075, partial [Desulfatiglandales bacterium]|nr:hypothetical protein [Desulfatiglandales bacterium]
KSLIALTTIAHAQTDGMVCAYFDCEGSFSKVFATKLGVDTNQLLLSRESAGEKVIEMACELLRSEKVSIIVFDSLAAMIPKMEIDDPMEQMQMAPVARMMSKALRKLTFLNKKTLIVFINQLRMNPGTRYGCIHGETLIRFKDGRVIPIKKVVENKINGRVMTFNDENFRGLDDEYFEYKKIKEWFYNGKVEADSDEFLTIKSQGIETKNGIFSVTVTKNHKLLTNLGWKEAGKIKKGNLLISSFDAYKGDIFFFLNAVAVGDSHIHVRNKTSASIRFMDSKNWDYVTWKVDKLSPFINFHRNANGLVSDYLHQFKLIKDGIGNNRNPLSFLEKYFSMLGFAVWIMDDGHFNKRGRYYLSVKRLKMTRDLRRVSDIFANLGFKNTVVMSSGTIIFNKRVSKKIASKICQFVPECMQYKLPEEFKGKYIEFDLTGEKYRDISYSRVLEVSKASQRKMRTRGKYDLGIDGNKNYAIGNRKNGIIVHNSAEYTPGGRALKFYASIRLDVRRGDWIFDAKDKKRKVGQVVKFRVVKNKSAVPLKEGYFKFLYKGEFDRVDELISLGLLNGKIERKGAFYYLMGKGYQGRAELESSLKAEPTLFEKARKEVFKE